MNTAVSKLQKDIWKNENPMQDEKKKNNSKAENSTNSKAVNSKNSKNEKGSVKTQTKLNDSQTESITKSQEEQSRSVPDELEAIFPWDMEQMEQTAVSKVRRGIFKLPKSSPYTEYYPPEAQEEQSRSVPEELEPRFVGRMQQTAVSQIRRGIFKLPKSSPYTEYYPPESQEVPGDSSEKSKRSNEKKTKEKVSEDKLETGNHETNESRDKAAADARAAPEKKELQRMKGLFFCDKCQKQWKSVHVYCEPGTTKVVHGQMCESCKTVQMPKLVRKLKPVTCNLFACSCLQKRKGLVKPQDDT